MSLWGTQLTLLQKEVMSELRLNESLSSGERSTRGRGVGVGAEVERAWWKGWGLFLEQEWEPWPELVSLRIEPFPGLSLFGHQMLPQGCVNS